MGYVESNLGKDEQILARVKHSKLGLVSSLLLIALLALGCYLILLLCQRIMEEVGTFTSTTIFLFKVVVWILLGLTSLWILFNSVTHIFSNQLVVTNKRVLGRSGLISKRVVDILLLNLDSITVHNGFFGAIFHYGSLCIVSAGTVGQPQMVSYVKNTEEFRRAVLAAVDRSKEEDRRAQAEEQAAALKRVQDQNK